MSPRKPSQARQKVLAAATDLFYQQGYQATTVDQVIEKSGVSKPTVYSHFSTKEDLCVAYLQEMRNRESGLLRESVRKQKSPKARFSAIIRHVRNRVINFHFRGCGFFNMISETADAHSPISKEAKIYVDVIREVIREVVTELKASESKYQNLDIDRLTDTYYLIVAGAIMASQEYRERWPVDRAVEHVEEILER